MFEVYRTDAVQAMDIKVTGGFPQMLLYMVEESLQWRKPLFLAGGSHWIQPIETGSWYTVGWGIKRWTFSDFIARIN